MQKYLIVILWFVDALPGPELRSILVRGVSIFSIVDVVEHRWSQQGCFPIHPQWWHSSYLLWRSLCCCHGDINIVLVAFNALLQLLNKEFRLLKRVYVVVKSYSKGMLWLPSFGLFHPLSVKPMLTKKIIIKKKKKISLHAHTKIWWVVPCKWGNLVQRGRFDKFGESIFPK